MTSNAENAPPPLRIGILGAARIARKTIAAIEHQASGCDVVAVASRSAAKANGLVDDHVAAEKRGGVKIFSGSGAYRDLVASSDLVDALYIPLPTTLKKEWTIRALRSKKHVLVEKPVAASAEDYREMIREAELANRYLMDGTMFVHHPRTESLLSCISREETFGAVSRVGAAFTILGHDEFMRNNIRVRKDGDCQGCVGDLGWYCIRLAQLTFRRVGFGKVKSAEVSDWKLNDEGVPIDATCLVTFQKRAHHDDDANVHVNDEDNRTLSFHCSYLHPWHQRGEVCGTKQTAEIISFVNPQEGTVSFQIHTADLMANVKSSALREGSVDMYVPCEVPQITLMWSNFHKDCKLVEERGWDEDSCSERRALSEISYENQLLVDALMESISGNGKVVSLP